MKIKRQEPNESPLNKNKNARTKAKRQQWHLKFCGTQMKEPKQKTAMTAKILWHSNQCVDTTTPTLHLV